ncbi:MAG: DegT/DnrJ/EryC1/StrS family aminotransferase [Bilophila wadsworthia]
MRFIDAPAITRAGVPRDDTTRHNYHLLAGCMKTASATSLHARHFEEKGIKCVVQYIPLDRYDFYKKLGLGEANCPNADAFFDGQISFPFQHWLSEEDFDYMLKSTREVLKACR